MLFMLLRVCDIPSALVDIHFAKGICLLRPEIVRLDELYSNSIVGKEPLPSDGFGLGYHSINELILRR